MKFKRKAIVYLAIVVSLLLLSVGIINIALQFLDLSPHHQLITEKIEAAIKRKVTIGDARISFLKGLSLVLENITIYEKGHKDNFITSDSFVITFYLSHLLKKHIAVKRIELINPVLHVQRNKKGEVNLINWFNEIAPNHSDLDRQGDKIPALLLERLTIEKGHFIYNDMKAGRKPLVTIIDDFDLDIKRPFFRKSLVGFMQGKVISRGKPAIFTVESSIQQKDGPFIIENLALKGKVEISSLNIEQFQPYLKQFSERIKWNGTVDLNINYDGDIVNGFRSKGLVKVRSFDSSREPVLSDPSKIHSSGINYELLWDKNKLNIHTLKIKLNDLVFTGNSLIEKPLSKNPLINFAFQSNSFDVKEYINNTPFSYILDPLRVINEKVSSGDMKIELIEFNGNMNQLKNIDKRENFTLLKGEIKANNFNFRINENWPVLKKFEGNIKFSKGTINLSDVSCRYKSSKINKLSFVVSNPFVNPMIDISAKASLQLNEIYKIIPREKALFKNLLDYEKIREVSGESDIQINLSGDPRKPSEIKYSGKLGLHNVVFKHNNLKYDLKNINGNIEFYSGTSLVPERKKELTRLLQMVKEKKINAGRYFFIPNMSARYGQSELIDVKGEVYTLPSMPIFNLTINSDIDLKEIYPLLVSNLNHANFGKIDSISGRSKLKVKINNYLAKSEALEVSGDLRLMNVSASYYDFPLRISELKGNLVFSENEIYLKNINGLIGKSIFSIEGKAKDYISKNPWLDLQLISETNTRDIIKLLPDSIKENFKANGAAGIKLKLKGDYRSLAARGEVDMTQLSYQYKNWIHKKIGQQNFINLDSVIEKLNYIYLNKFKITLGDSKVLGDGNITGFKNPYLDVRIHTNNFDFAEAVKLSEYLDDKQVKGKITASLSANGQVKTGTKINIKGKASIKNGSYKFDFSPNAIDDISAKFNFNNEKISINKAAFYFGESDANISGEINGFEKPIFFLKLKSKILNLNEILPVKTKSIKELNALFKSSSWLQKSRGIIHLNADSGRFRVLKFPRIKGDIELIDGLITFNKTRIYSDNKIIIGKGTLDFLSDSGLRFSLWLKGKSFPARDIENIFEKYFRESLTGKLSLATQLNGKGFDLGQILASLSGKLSLLINKGDYNKNNLIKGIKSIWFKPENDIKDANEAIATKFRTIKGDFILKNGIAKTKNYFIETKKRRTSVIGVFDLKEKNLNLSVGVAPWQNLNKAVSKIPIVGSILTGGDDKSILITYYSVKGPMNSPEVKAVPIKSLGNKVIGLFKGLLQAPKHIFVPPKRNTGPQKRGQALE